MEPAARRAVIRGKCGCRGTHLTARLRGAAAPVGRWGRLPDRPPVQGSPGTPDKNRPMVRGAEIKPVATV